MANYHAICHVIYLTTAKPKISLFSFYFKIICASIKKFTQVPFTTFKKTFTTSTDEFSIIKASGINHIKTLQPFDCQ